MSKSRVRAVKPKVKALRHLKFNPVFKMYATLTTVWIYVRRTVYLKFNAIHTWFRTKDETAKTT